MDVKDIATTIEKSILDGEVDKTEAAIFLKRIEKIVATVLESKPIKEAFRVNFEKYKKVKAFGAIVEYGSTYTSYNYDLCNHDLYNAWKRIAIEAAANMKIIEKELRELQDSDKEIVITEVPVIRYESSGDIITICHPVKTEQFGPKFKF